MTVKDAHEMICEFCDLGKDGPILINNLLNELWEWVNQSRSIISDSDKGGMLGAIIADCLKHVATARHPTPDSKNKAGNGV